ncbi:MAG: hypothetical protein AVDCRST_MAG67-2838, partial [uncultured Solirubrobacteraceae bacterium]
QPPPGADARGVPANGPSAGRRAGAPGAPADVPRAGAPEARTSL